MKGISKILEFPGVTKQREELDKMWNDSVRMFGDILKSAFADNMSLRDEFTKALTYISRGDLSNGREKLDEIKNSCACDADKAAWNYFYGLSFEREKNYTQALPFMLKSAGFEPSSYIVYLQIGQMMHKRNNYAGAVDYYERALKYLLESKDLLCLQVNASLFGNIASCYIMMRQYNKAEKMLLKAGEFSTNRHILNVHWAMLLAAKNEKTKAHERLAQYMQVAGDNNSETVNMIKAMIRCEHPHFFICKTNADDVSDFWDWFLANTNIIKVFILTGNTENAICLITEKLNKVFSFHSLPFNIDVSFDGNFNMAFHNEYSISLEVGFEDMINAAPEIPEWNFSHQI